MESLGKERFFKFFLEKEKNASQEEKEKIINDENYVFSQPFTLIVFDTGLSEFDKSLIEQLGLSVDDVKVNSNEGQGSELNFTGHSHFNPESIIDQVIQKINQINQWVVS